MKTQQYMYNELVVLFSGSAWLNATKVAAHFGKRIQDYQDNHGTKEFIAIIKKYNPDLVEVVKTKEGRGGGTWMHPDLAIHFGTWLDPEFGYWCSQQIKFILTHPEEYKEWKEQRKDTALSNRVLNAMIKETLMVHGTIATQKHYESEILMINEIMTGEYRSIKRDDLSKKDLKILSCLEMRDALYYTRALPYARRKPALTEFAKIVRAYYQDNDIGDIVDESVEIDINPIIGPIAKIIN